MICKIIGDSIALGLALANPQCDRDAVVGRSTYVVSQRSAVADQVVISAGSNIPTRKSYRQLRSMRANRIRARQVTWILPVNSIGRVAVIRTAAEFGDRVVSFRPGRDGVHPRSYRILSRDVRAIWATPRK